MLSGSGYQHWPSSLIHATAKNKLSIKCIFTREQWLEPRLSSEVPAWPKEILAAERGYVGVSKYLLLEPTKSSGATLWAGSSSFICSLCAHSIASSSTVSAAITKSTQCCSWWLVKNQHLPTPSSGHRELLFQQHFSNACEVISNSSYHCSLMEDGLINYITLSQLSMLRDNKNTVSPSSKISSKLTFYRCLHKDPAINKTPCV